MHRDVKPQNILLLKCQPDLSTGLKTPSKSWVWRNKKICFSELWFVLGRNAGSRFAGYLVTLVVLKIFQRNNFLSMNPGIPVDQVPHSQVAQVSRISSSSGAKFWLHTTAPLRLPILDCRDWSPSPHRAAWQCKLGLGEASIPCISLPSHRSTVLQAKVLCKAVRGDAESFTQHPYSPIPPKK